MANMTRAIFTMLKASFQVMTETTSPPTVERRAFTTIGKLKTDVEEAGKLGEHVPAQTIGPRPRVPLRQGPLQEGCAGYHLRKLVVACRKRQLSQKEGRMGGKHHQNHQQQGNCLVRDSSTPPPTRRKGTRASTRRSSRRRNARPRSRRPHLRLARRSRFSPHGRTPPSAPFSGAGIEETANLPDQAVRPVLRLNEDPRHVLSKYPQAQELACRP